MPSFPSLSTVLVRAKNDRRGVTIIEYGLLAALIAVALIGVIGTTLEGSLNGIFTSIAGAI
jgi:pilus assembly protein Flp/PilA